MTPETRAKLAAEFEALADRAALPAASYPEQHASRAVLGLWALNHRAELSAALRSSDGFRLGIEAAIAAAERVGSFGDYKREELTEDYGQPRFDMMHDIIASLRALAPADDAGMVERIARAICIADGYDPDEDWRNVGAVMLDVALEPGKEQRWRTYTRQAKAALAAMKEGL